MNAPISCNWAKTNSQILVLRVTVVQNAPFKFIVFFNIIIISLFFTHFISVMTFQPFVYKETADNKMY